MPSDKRAMALDPRTGANDRESSIPLIRIRFIRVHLHPFVAHAPSESHRAVPGRETIVTGTDPWAD